MRVYGIVKDTPQKMPLACAKVCLYMGEKELVVLHSDSEGQFEHKWTADYTGENLICRVEKRGFEPLEVTYKIQHEEVHLELQLVPEEEKVGLKISIKDEKRNPLEGVKVTLEVEGEQVGIGFSDKNGLFKITLSPDFKDKKIKYKAELGGFELSSGEIQLNKKTSLEINMRSLPVPVPGRWSKIVTGAGGIIGVIIAAIIIYKFLIPNELPRVDSFRASPPIIEGGGVSTLEWSTSDAEEVEIIGIGRVPLSGSRRVSPTETTTYILIARNELDRTLERSVTVEVERFRVMEAYLEVDPSNYIGFCPREINFRGNITVNGRGTVRYTFIRSDGVTTSERILEFNGPGSEEVENSWELDDDYEGWQKIAILSPNEMESNQANFTFRCGE